MPVTIRGHLLVSEGHGAASNEATSQARVNIVEVDYSMDVPGRLGVGLPKPLCVDSTPVGTNVSSERES